MDLLEIGPVNACKKAFKIDEAIGKLLNHIVLGRKVFQACEKKKKNRSQVEGNRRAHAQ